jgi:hypothetical protein
VVELLTHNHKVKGSSLATAAGTGGKKMVKKSLLPNFDLILYSLTVVFI